MASPNPQSEDLRLVKLLTKPTTVKELAKMYAFATRAAFERYLREKGVTLGRLANGRVSMMQVKILIAKIGLPFV
jgi:hypothetical protein